MKFRLLPIIIFSCAILLLIKLGDIARGTNELTETFLISSSVAETKEKKEDKEKKEEKTSEDKSKDSEKPKEGAEEKKEEKPDETKPPGQTRKQIDGEEVVDGEYSKTEVEILQRLSKRREELDSREKELKEQENILALTEQRIDKKIAELKDLKSQTETILAEYNKKEDEKVKSLVKMYENMKPKDAAEIFETLDNTTILLIVNKMKEAKAAPILALIKPEKSKEITVEFARQKKLPDQLETN